MIDADRRASAPSPRGRPAAPRPRRRASDSARPTNGSAMPLNTPRPSCSMVDVLPCIGTRRAHDLRRRTRRRSPGARGRRRGSASSRRAARITSIVMPASSGRPGPGEITIRSGLQRRDLVDRDGVVAHDLHVGAELAEVLHEVVGERIVVVDDADHGSRHVRGPAARARARGAAPAPCRASLRIRPSGSSP